MAAVRLKLVLRWRQREKPGQQQSVAMHVNERFSVASGGLMKHVRIATALCSAVGHLHIMMYGGALLHCAHLPLLNATAAIPSPGVMWHF